MLLPAPVPWAWRSAANRPGGIRHVLIRDCVFVDAASQANIKANRQRVFARVQDIRVENIIYTNSMHVDRWWNRALVSVDLFLGDTTAPPW